jgi:hypothetical protein
MILGLLLAAMGALLAIMAAPGGMFIVGFAGVIAGVILIIRDFERNG